MTAQFDVVLVGYGPTAQLLALALGRQGRSVAVVERWEERYPLPRAVHIDHEVYRILAANGLGAGLAAICHGVPKYQWFNADWRELLVIDQSETPVSGGSSANYVNQPLLEEVLDEGVRAQPGVRLFLGREAVSVGQDEDGAWVTARHAATGEAETLRGRYLIGCDGANSVVRGQIPGVVEDLGFQEHWLVVDVLLKDGVTVEGLGLPESGQYCNPARPTTIVPGGIGNGRLFRRWEFMKLPGESIEELESEDKVWELLAPWAGPDQVELVRHKTYNFRSLLPDQWRDRRIMIAGDAAHLTPPFMGQGLCSGIRDSWNLAWRLALALDGKATDRIFDDYTRERRPHVRRLIEMAIYLGEVICVADPDEAARRDAAFASGDYPPFPDFPSLTDGLLHRLPDGAPRPGAGLLAPHVAIGCGGRAERMDAVFGPGFLIVTRDASAVAGLSAPARALLDRIGAGLLVLGEGAEAWRDLDGRMTGFLAQQGWTAMIVRPDFLVYGGAATGEAFARLMEDFARDLVAAGLDAPQPARGRAASRANRKHKHKHEQESLT